MPRTRHLISQVRMAIVLALCVGPGCQCDVDFAKFFRVCHRDAADAQECLVSAVQEGVAKLATGVPEVGLPPLDPHVQDQAHFDYSNRQITAEVQMSNIRTAGLKDAKIKAVRVRTDSERFRLELEAVQGGVDIEGEYHAQGRYNTMHVDASGQFNATIRKIKYRWVLEGVPEERDGEVYCRVRSFHLRPDIGDMRFHVSNLFPDNPELAELVNTVSNQNWRTLYRELLPMVQQKWNLLGVDVANKIFLSTPCHKLFPQRSERPATV